VPRRCRPLSASGVIGSANGLVVLAGLAALAALCPLSARAQTVAANTAGTNTITTPANADADLFLPSLQGTPNNPSRFVLRGNTMMADQAPPTGAFTGSAIPSAPPVYGSPTGFGAGNTGFDSTNARRRQRARVPNNGTAIVPPQETSTFDPVPAPPPEVPSRPPVLAPPLPPEVYPSRAASRPGATLPPPPDELPISNPPAEVHPLAAALRPGAVLPLPPPPLDVTSPASTPPPGTPLPGTLPLGAVPRPTLPFIGGDPYEALGIKAGSFLILPAVELSAGYDSNPQHTPGGPGSSTFIVAPELHARSDWASNSLTADIVGSYYWYGNDEAFQPSLNRPYLNSKIDGRLDVTRDTQILLENRVIVSTDNPGSPNIQANLAKLPIDTTVGGTLGVDQQFSRFDATLKGTIDRTTYQPSQFVDGETENNDDRAYDQYAGIFRLAYMIDPGFKPFVEVSADRRDYDSPVDFFGEDRSSTGSSAKFGGEFKLGGTSLVGEMAVGYLQRDYEGPNLPNIAGMTIDGSLLWLVSGLTTVKFTAVSQVNESTLQGVSGDFSRDVSVEVDHALRRWLIATGTVGYGHDDYVGEAREDDRYYAVAGLVYKLNPLVQVKGQLRHDWLTSTQSGNAYQSTSVFLTLRLQR
jgi:hypothetical protein